MENIKKYFGTNILKKGGRGNIFPLSKKMDLDKKIEIKRELLHNILDITNNNFLDKRVIEISQELDILILEAQKKLNNNKKG